jgi:hypothetical protein
MQQLQNHPSFAPAVNQGLIAGEKDFVGLYQLQCLSRRRWMPVRQPLGLLADFLCRLRSDRIVLFLRTGMFAGRGAV